MCFASCFELFRGDGASLESLVKNKFSGLCASFQWDHQTRKQQGVLQQCCETGLAPQSKHSNPT